MRREKATEQIQKQESVGGKKKKNKGYFPTYIEKTFHKYLLGGRSTKD